MRRKPEHPGDCRCFRCEQNGFGAYRKPAPQKETFEEFWAVFNKTEFARAKLGIGTDYAPFGSSNYFVLKSCAEFTWNAAKGGTNCR